MTIPSASNILVGEVLQDLANEAEIVLLTASALENQACGISSHAPAQKLLEMAALLKSAAQSLVLAAANVVGSAERLRVVAEFTEFDEASSGDLPS